MHRIIRGTSTLGVLALLVGTLLVGSGGSAAADSYMPAPGVRFNNPIGTSASKRAIQTHIIRSIYSSPKGSRIRVMSWNIRDHAAVVALVRAHRRGVSVQVIMERINAYQHEPDETNPIPASPDPNPDFFWMKRELSKGNATRKAGYRSWAKLCVHSCRGRGGLAHVKMYLFDHVTHERYVMMYTSGNLTDAATSAQWNDMYTAVNRPQMWRFALRRFAEMAQDQPMANAWRVQSFGPNRPGFFPWKGAGAVGDPVQRVFNQIKCSGATGGTGTNGHTKIRVAQTALAGTRGVRLAKSLKGLWNRGCDVKMVYGLINPEARAALRSTSGRGPMPMRQMVQDFDGDFVYDRYLHQKSMTVSGVYGAQTNANYVWNGSANWVGYTLGSDEIFARISSAGLVRRYNNFVDYWYAHVPRSARGTAPAGFARFVNIDPYAKFQIN